TKARCCHASVPRPPTVSARNALSADFCDRSSCLSGSATAEECPICTSRGGRFAAVVRGSALRGGLDGRRRSARLLCGRIGARGGARTTVAPAGVFFCEHRQWLA